MLAEIYMLRLEAAARTGSSDKFVSVRPRLVAGSEGVLTRRVQRLPRLTGGDFLWVILLAAVRLFGAIATEDSSEVGVIAT
jgi:hypothetical protein